MQVVARIRGPELATSCISAWRGRATPPPGPPGGGPAPGHPVGGQDRAGQDPGVGQRAPGAQGTEDDVEDRGEDHGADQQLEPPGPAGPAGAYADPFPARGPLELVPADEAVDADREEEDLPAGLAVEVQVVRGVEDAAEEDREQQ